MKLHPVLLAAAIAAAAATSASAQSTPAPADTAAPAPAPAASRPVRVRRNPNVITAADLEGQVAADVYELVRRLRPQWLRGRASSTNGDQTKSMSSDPIAGPPNPAHGAPPVYVFVDGNRMGDASELRQLQVSSVRELRFIPSEEAVTRWGRDYSAGAIEVTSR